MNPPRVNVDPITDAKRLPGRALVPRVRDGELAPHDEVRRQAPVRVRGVVCVPFFDFPTKLASRAVEVAGARGWRTARRST